MLSKEYENDGMIKVDRLREILSDMGCSDGEILALTNQVQMHVKEGGYFDFEEFVSSSF